MRQGTILYKLEPAGILTQEDDGSFHFRYTDLWFENTNKPAISLTLPKSKQNHTSNHLFPCFYSLLPEGHQKEYFCIKYKIDPDDAFGLFMISCSHESIGAITIHEIQNK